MTHQCEWLSVAELCAKDAPVRYGILQPGPEVADGVYYIRPKEIVDDVIEVGSLRRTTHEIAKQYRRSSLLPNDIILSIVGTIGKVAVVPESLAGANITQSSARIRADTSKINVAYLAWCLRSPVLIVQFEAFRMGTAVTRLNIDHVRRLKIPVPPLPEQKRIVGILDEAFDGIATAKANAEKNLQNARDIFQSCLQAIFAQHGEGWVKTTIGDACTLKSGTTLSPTLEKPTGDVPYLKVADMTFGGNDDRITTSSRFLDTADVKEGAIIPIGATIFPKRGGAILTNKKRIALVPICADLNIMAVIPSPRIDAIFLYLYFLNVDMRMLGTGSSIPQINNYDIAPLPIAFPEKLSEQRQIAIRLEKLRVESQALESICQRKLIALDELKKSLLHRAFTGQL